MISGTESQHKEGKTPHLCTNRHGLHNEVQWYLSVLMKLYFQISMKSRNVRKMLRRGHCRHARYIGQVVHIGPRA